MQWEELMKLEFGTWDETPIELIRHNKLYPIGLCRHCNHVQMMSTYTDELFSLIYFNSTQEAIFWHEDLVDSLAPYEEMIALFSDAIHPKSTIVDFGCGPGSLLTIINNTYPKAKLNLIGVDFNKRTTNPAIQYIHADLNKMTAEQMDKIDTIDIAIASHTLEHVISPVNFLSAIAGKLRTSGLIFIEIPDFSNADELGTHAGQSNLVNLQHIHYYTKDSIYYLADQVGLEVVTIRQLITGYIPRLQVLFKKSTAREQIPKIKLTAAPALLEHKKVCAKKMEHFKDIIIEQIKRHGRVGLWGVGAECFMLFKQHPELKEYVLTNQIELFDYHLAEHTFMGHKIESSSKLQHYKAPVFITPQLAETRIKMHTLSADWGIELIDSYRLLFQ
jgi:2-polyprenyl-3-methyl-5-hydroxy-6-metoxy-1,4-benzoquinol methylase